MNCISAGRLIVLLLVAVALQGQLNPGKWRTDLSRKSIDLAELKMGGPAKDGIPAVDRPLFVSPQPASSWVDPKEPVLVIEHGGEARAYPLQILVWHELVNDQIRDLPIAVTYCPLCNSAVVFDRRVDGKVYDFGVSGMLHQSNLILYDRQTDSLWQQFTGEAIVGTLTGRILKIVRSQTTSFDTFSRVFPRGKVLSRETGYRREYGQTPYAGYEFGNRLMMPVRIDSPARQAPLERIVTVTSDDKGKAYPVGLLRHQGSVADRVGKKRFVIFFQQGMVTPLDQSHIAASRDVGAAAVFSPEVEGKHLNFRRKDGRVVDKETGSVWNLLGLAVEGPLTGKRLTPVEHRVYFAFAGMAFSPHIRIAGDGTSSDLRHKMPEGIYGRQDQTSPTPP